MRKLDNPKITRIEIEKFSDGTLWKYWTEGWQSGDPPIQQEVGFERLFDALHRLEQEGFTVDMPSMDVGRALRGEITRIDFYQTAPNEWTVKKYPFGWTARTRPIERQVYKDFDIEGAIQWCRDHNWQTRRWDARDGIPAGYRAFRYKQEPIRDTYTIQIMRNRIPAAQVDFAFDC